MLSVCNSDNLEQIELCLNDDEVVFLSFLAN